MGTTADKLQKIINTKAAIKEVANQHGAEITDDTPFSEYDEAIVKGFETLTQHALASIFGDTNRPYGQECIDIFWDLYQSKGERTDWKFAFAYTNWDNTRFKPKYDIKVGNGANMFWSSNLSGDFRQTLSNLGISFDTTKCENWIQAFQSTRITHFPEMDASEAENVSYMFPGTTVEIDKLIMSEKTAKNYGCGSMFSNASRNLQKIVIEGTIATNFNVKESTVLTLESAKSIITALKDFSGTDKEYAYTCQFSSVTKELLDADGNTAPHGGTWLEYASDIKRWNV